MIRIYYLFFAITIVFASCASDAKQKEESDSNAAEQAAPAPPSPAEQYEWTRLADNPGYSKSYNFQMFAVGDKAYVIHTDGTWETSDGKTWTKTGLNNIINNQAFLDYVEFKGAVYALGTFSGGIFEHTISSQIARTTDFKKWEIVAKTSNLPKRFFYHPFVFQDKLWIIGGNDGQTIYEDVWTSTDGVKWEKVAETVPFGAGHSQYFVVLKDQLYMLAQTVWVSKDGINWSIIKDGFTSEDLIGYTPVVFDDKIWLIGNNGGRKLGSQVFFSEDGIKWQMMQAPWSPRGSVAACVFKNQLLITGGKYGGQEPIGAEYDYVNDVWAMQKK